MVNRNGMEKKKDWFVHLTIQDDSERYNNNNNNDDDDDDDDYKNDIKVHLWLHAMCIHYVLNLLILSSEIEEKVTKFQLHNFRDIERIKKDIMKCFMRLSAILLCHVNIFFSPPLMYFYFNCISLQKKTQERMKKRTNLSLLKIYCIRFN